MASDKQCERQGTTGNADRPNVFELVRDKVAQCAQMGNTTSKVTCTVSQNPDNKEDKESSIGAGRSKNRPSHERPGTSSDSERQADTPMFSPHQLNYIMKMVMGQTQSSPTSGGIPNAGTIYEDVSDDSEATENDTALDVNTEADPVEALVTQATTKGSEPEVTEAEEAASLLTELKEFFGDSDDVGDKVGDQLATTLNEGIQKPFNSRKVKDCVEKYKRPKNCESLVTPLVNPDIWGQAKSYTRTRDIKLQQVQGLLLKAIVPVVRVTDDLLNHALSKTPLDMSAMLRKNMDVLKLLSATAAQLSQVRRDQFRPDLQLSYKQLCQAPEKTAKFLFGDDVASRIKTISETDKITRTLGNDSRKMMYNSYNRDHRKAPYWEYKKGRGGTTSPATLFSLHKTNQGPFFRQEIPATRVEKLGPQISEQTDMGSSLQCDRENTAQNKEGHGRVSDDCTPVDNAKLVQCVVGTLSGLPSTTSKVQTATTANPSARASSPPHRQIETDSFQIIRRSLQGQGVSTNTIEIILHSWRESTRKQYRVYLQKWVLFCTRRQTDPLSPTLADVLDFLTELYESGLGYSGINTARSALSSIVQIDNIPVGQHFLVKRFVKAVFNLKPALPRYGHAWDVATVLTYLSHKPDPFSVLKWTTLKLCMLLALLTGQRLQTLHLIDIRNVEVLTDKMIIRIGDLLKQTRPGFHQADLSLPRYHEKELCVVNTFEQYLTLTKNLRKENTNLFVSFQKPFKPVSKDTISRWIKMVMSEAGIDISVFKPHSVRMTSTSTAAAGNIPLSTILKAAGWTAESTFRRFYHKPISDEGLFSEKIMNTIS